MRAVALASLLLLLAGCGGSASGDSEEVPRDDPPATEEPAEATPAEEPAREEPTATGGDERAACAVDVECESIQCLRAVTCVAECGDEPVDCGCCPCADGWSDAIECAADR